MSAPQRQHLDVRKVDLGQGVWAGFSDRCGGVSNTAEGRHDYLNLGYHVGEDWDYPHANRGLLGGWLGAPITFTSQVHGARVAEVPHHRPNMRTKADSLITTARGVGIGVMVADCVPVLLADSQAGVVATAHAGRPGLVAGVVPNAVAAMIARGATASTIRAALGPSICGHCYEVPQQLRDAVESTVPGTAGTTSWGTPSIDIASGVVSQLRAAGLTQIQRLEICTFEDDHFYSYRRDGVTGRFAGVIALR